MYGELGISVSNPSMAFQRIPLFLGHGMEDEKVPLHLGQEAASYLKAMGMNVSGREYKGLAHWYSPAMLGDLIDSLQKSKREETS